MKLKDYNTLRVHMEKLYAVREKYLSDFDIGAVDKLLIEGQIVIIEDLLWKENNAPSPMDDRNW
jgi:hypothetical protein